MTLQFKLTKENGLTRKITFATPPSWSILSARISALYNIAANNIGVSYVDSDGDEVTLSSDDELQDVYATLLVTNNGAIKFAVHDLGSLRSVNTTVRSLPSAAPQQPPFRNTFGGHEVLPLVFDAEDEWQRLPGNLGSLFLSRDAPDSPHAFVEVLESDVSRSEAAGSGGGDASRSDVTCTPAEKDKGKARAVMVEDDVSSAGSVIGDEAPAKPPVHVFDMSSDDMFAFSPQSTVQLPRSGAATPAQAQSTPLIMSPVIPEQSMKVDTSIDSEEGKAAAFTDDPPLPSLDLSDPNPAPPSLVHDIATFLTTISTVISTHPELSHRFRDILNNASNGTYWAAHRDAISRAAEDLHRTAVQETGRSLEELRRATEQEANARVTEAAGRIFRAVGDFAQGPIGQGHTTPAPQASENTMPAPNGVAPEIPRTPPGSTAQNIPRWSHLPPNPRGQSWFRPFPPPVGPSWGMPHPPPPPPPPPPPAPGSFPPRGVMPNSASWLPAPGWPRPPPHIWGRNFGHSEPVHPRSSFADIPTRAHATEPLTQTTVQPVENAESSPEVLRAKVETAKAEYKAQKERYRQAKANRKASDPIRHDKGSPTESISRQTSDNPAPVVPDNNGPAAAPSAAEPPIPVPEEPTTATVASGVHIVSNARGRYPQLEMFSVPRRSHTTGHMNRPLNRIMRKLSDMGFTEGAYPNLTGKVMDQLLSHPPVNKDAEDDIVTNLIEELIPTSGAPAGTSGGIPGAWH